MRMRKWGSEEMEKYERERRIPRGDAFWTVDREMQEAGRWNGMPREKLNLGLKE